MGDLLQASSVTTPAVTLGVGAIVGSIVTLIAVRLVARRPAQPAQLWDSASPTDKLWLDGRLEDQIRYYERAAITASMKYHVGRILVLVAAASITVTSVTAGAFPGLQVTWVAGTLSAAIALIEGFEGLFHWRDSWLNYRATAEALKREQWLYLAKGGDYKDSTNASPVANLAERVESLVQGEFSRWRQIYDQPGDRKGPPSRPGQETPVDQAPKSTGAPDEPPEVQTAE